MCFKAVNGYFTVKFQDKNYPNFTANVAPYPVACSAVWLSAL
jgi:hypothetical protein